MPFSIITFFLDILIKQVFFNLAIVIKKIYQIHLFLAFRTIIFAWAIKSIMDSLLYNLVIFQFCIFQIFLFSENIICCFHYAEHMILINATLCNIYKKHEHMELQTNRHHFCILNTNIIGLLIFQKSFHPSFNRLYLNVSYIYEVTTFMLL